MTDTQKAPGVTVWHYVDHKSAAGYGPWVRHVDYQALTAERDALAAENERMREALSFVDDTISWEINPSNYDHQDVCNMNADWCEVGNVARVALEEGKDG